MENKDLITFFGQYRNFNYIVPHLNLDVNSDLAKLFKQNIL